MSDSSSDDTLNIDERREKLAEKLDQETNIHHIFAKDDQEQLADIIEMLGGEKKTTNEKYQEVGTLKEKYSKTQKETQNENVLPQKKQQTENVSEEEVVALFERLAKFDMNTIAQNQALYDVFLEKLKKYKDTQVFLNLMQDDKYYFTVIEHLNFLSKKIIDEQKNIEMNQIAARG